MQNLSRIGSRHLRVRNRRNEAYESYNPCGLASTRVTGAFCITSSGTSRTLSSRRPGRCNLCPAGFCCVQRHMVESYRRSTNLSLPSTLLIVPHSLSSRTVKHDEITPSPSASECGVEIVNRVSNSCPPSSGQRFRSAIGTGRKWVRKHMRRTQKPLRENATWMPQIDNHPARPLARSDADVRIHI